MRTTAGIILASLFALAPVVHAATLDPEDAASVSSFSIAHQTQVPGEVLKPGDYSIKIVEHISDRMIVRIDSVAGKQHVIFLGVPNFDNDPRSTGPQTWTSSPGLGPTLRGFNFPSGTAVDFVYPKAEAATLAKSNSATIVAIDPESEGRPGKLQNLSSDDMREINLWMLTLLMTGPDKKTPALEAKHYKAPISFEQASQPVQVQPTVAPPPAGQTSSAGTQVAALEPVAAPVPHPTHRKMVASELPHTASATPLIVLTGLAAFSSALLLMLRRRISVRQPTKV